MLRLPKKTIKFVHETIRIMNMCHCVSNAGWKIAAIVWQLTRTISYCFLPALQEQLIQNAIATLNYC